MANIDPDQFELETFLPFELHQASEALSQSFAKIYRDGYGMTRTEWRVFAHLGQKGAMTATQIGAAAKLHKTKVSRAVYSLEQRKWLTRTDNSEDRRVQTLHLTTLGQSTFKKLSSDALNFNLKLKQQLGAETFDSALTLLRKIQDYEQSS
ncbi:MAG: MarR family winged helix-turn-helix transcriptional regulator [Hyphomicrobiales bacterium]